MYCFIINRNAGGGKALKAWAAVKRMLECRKIGFTAQLSESSEEGAAITKSWLADHAGSCKAIVVIGGDGTVQAIVRELAGMRSNVPIGLIPAGTGNDLARALGIPPDPEGALECLLRGSVRKLDVGRVGDRYFTTVLGMGFDAKVVETVASSWYKKLGRLLRSGKLPYMAGIVRTLFFYRPSQVRIRVDGRTNDFPDVWLAAVANSPTYGGGMRVCPAADMEDGQLDLCVIHGISRWSFIRLIPLIIRGEHANLPAVTMLRGARVEIEAEAAMLAYGDGEKIGEGCISVDVVPQNLSVIANL